MSVTSRLCDRIALIGAEDIGRGRHRSPANHKIELRHCHLPYERQRASFDEKAPYLHFACKILNRQALESIARALSSV